VLKKSQQSTIFNMISVVLMIAGVLIAGSAGAMVDPPNSQDLSQGKWELSLAKSKFCKTTPQKSSRDIFDAGWGLIVVEQSGINAAGKPTSGRYVARYDGDKYPDIVTGAAREAIIWKQISPTRVEFAHVSKEDRVTSEYIRTVSADGQVMIQHGKFIGQDCEEDQVFDRVN
jgi:hypothetical protein